MLEIKTEILAWASKLRPWQQDALRRLAGTEQLATEDENELVAILKVEQGIAVEPAPPAPIHLTADHLLAASQQHLVRVKAVSQVRNVNRLAEDQRLDFELNGLTAIYGPNGSGKSGYTRILRNACRSRTSSVDGKRKAILADAYHGAAAPGSALLHLDSDGSAVEVSWTDGTQPHELLAEISVFDSEAAALYVDEGSHIAFLPFNLDLFFRLNGVCVRLRDKLEAEVKELKDILEPVAREFPVTTEAGSFLANLSAETNLEAIEEAATWNEAHAERLQKLTNFLSGQDQGEVANLQTLATWATRMADRIALANELMGEQADQKLQVLQTEAVASRAAADSASEMTFSGDCLPGVGSDTWRRLYAAAKDYSLQAAYLGRSFPVVDDGARCVLCHQELASSAAERLRRFDAFVTGELARKANNAENELRRSLEAIATLVPFATDEDLQNIERLRELDTELAARIDAWIAAAGARKADLLATAIPIERGMSFKAQLDPHMADALTEFANRLNSAIIERNAARKGEERQRLEFELRELESRQRLSVLQPLIKQRVKDLELEAALKKCLEATNTAPITRKAGELSESYLTPRVQELFNGEIIALRLTHLNPAVARRPDKRGAHYKTDLGPTIKCRCSEILSEGEHRALALASFLAEVKAVSDQGTIVVDDPVSSLDNERSQLVALRLAQEAQRRQVIVFTHSLVFLHHLAVATEKYSVDMECRGIYRSDRRAGMLDPGGEPWQGKSLKRRLGIMDGLLASLRRAEYGPPQQYGMLVRNFYGRLRDCWERLVEEKVLYSVVTRFDQVIKTQNLRYVEVTDELQRRIEAGMDRSSTFSHDNPASETDPMPTTNEAAADLEELRAVDVLTNQLTKAAETRRKSPVMTALVTPTAAAPGT
jgi:ABC-type hemin transport system ATPase subunit